MRFLIPTIIIFLFGSIANAEIVTVTTHTSKLLNNPFSSNVQTILEAPRFYPLSVLEERNGFFRVSDYHDRTGWIEKPQVGNKKGVVVEAARVNVRKGPDMNHPVVLKAFKGVTFHVLNEQGEWLEVEHESGKGGWVSKELTWGR